MVIVFYIKEVLLYLIHIFIELNMFSLIFSFHCFDMLYQFSVLISSTDIRCCKSSLSVFNLLLPKREPTFSPDAAFASVLPASSFFDLIPCFTSSSRCSVCCCLVCNYCSSASSSPVCRIKTVVLDCCHMPCF